MHFFSIIPSVLHRLSALTVFCLLACASFAHAATLNVPTQYATIQAAVNAAASGDTVLVAAGTYSGAGNRDIDFKGKNLTVISSAGAASTIIDCGGFYSSDGSGNHRGFYIHSGETAATISGFTIKNGYETPISTITDSIVGGGIYTDNTSSGTITVTNCIITASIAADGGGIGNDNLNGTTIVTNCTVTANTASDGGGIYNSNYGSSGTITLTKCTISSNTATIGGGIYNYNYASSGVINTTNCTVSGNSAIQGGGIYSGNGTITAINCIISGNTAQNSGGGILIFGGDIATLTNCTISNNTAPYGGGIENGGNRGFSYDSIYLSNCIVYSDFNNEIIDDSTAPFFSTNATYCDIQGGYPGTGNINADPLFANAVGGDFHLQSGSPCLGAGAATGAPTTDKDGHTRPNPPSIGAYELVAATTPPATTHILWDNANTASIWNYSPITGGFTQNTYGPYANWSAKAIADGGTDGLIRVLWDKTDGTASIWSLNNATAAFTQFTFGPYSGWTASGVSVGPDNTTHVLWTNGNTASIWNYSTANGTFTQETYGPYAGWSAKAIADGGTDGQTRVLWVNTNGMASIWSLNNTSGVFT